MTRDLVVGLAAMAVAGTACLLWLWAPHRGRSKVEKGADTSQLENKLALVALQIDELRQGLMHAKAEVEASGEEISPEREPYSNVAARLEAIEQNLDLIENKIYSGLLKEAEERADRSDVPVRPIVQVDLMESQLAIDAISIYQAAFLDNSIAMKKRIVALEALTRFPAHLRATDPIIDELAGLLIADDELPAREMVVDTANEIIDERLVGPYIHILDTSDCDDLRMEVVRNLKRYANVPGVRAALEAVAEEEGGLAKVTAQDILEWLDK